VEVLYETLPPRHARLLSAPAARANVFVVNEALDDVRGIRAYDANGKKVAGCLC
jgi:hypothetical protein